MRAYNENVSIFIGVMWTIIAVFNENFRLVFLPIGLSFIMYGVAQVGRARKK